MNKDIAEKILERLDGIESRIAKLEHGDANPAKGKTPKVISGRKKTKKKGVALIMPIKKLVEQGFFQDWKTDNDVVEKLKKQVLIAKRPSVSNVLRKLASPAQGLLQREGEGNKKHPWRYKQS